ncbi:unnamed protein product [Closterium sp. NIES-53]
MQTVGLHQEERQTSPSLTPVTPSPALTPVSLPLSLHLSLSLSHSRLSLSLSHSRLSLSLSHSRLSLSLSHSRLSLSLSHSHLSLSLSPSRFSLSPCHSHAHSVFTRIAVLNTGIGPPCSVEHFQLTPGGEKAVQNGKPLPLSLPSLPLPLSLRSLSLSHSRLSLSLSHSRLSLSLSHSRLSLSLSHSHLSLSLSPSRFSLSPCYSHAHSVFTQIAVLNTGIGPPCSVEHFQLTPGGKKAVQNGKPRPNNGARQQVSTPRSRGGMVPTKLHGGEGSLMPSEEAARAMVAVLAVAKTAAAKISEAARAAAGPQRAASGALILPYP